MEYKRKKQDLNKLITVKGYTKEDGTKVGCYKRKKKPSTTYRTIKKTK